MFGQQTSIRPNAPVCAFYQKGQCKYGTQCWNLHPPNQGAAVGGMASTFGGNVFGAKTGTQADSKEFTEFMKQVSVEMSQWERNGQWLFSSFTPLKSHPLLAGFSDHSPEEMRVKSYEALKTNTFTAYQDQWNKLQQQYKQLRDALRGPTSDAYQAMKEVFYSKSSSDQQLQNPSQNGKSGSVFGKPAGTLFGGNSSIFGGGGSVFGGNQPPSANMFGDSAKKTLFGGPAALGSQSTNSFGSQPNASPFGGGNTNLFKGSGGSVFGGSKMQGSLFGGTPATTQTSGSIFGGGVPVSTTTASIFGGGTSANPVTSTTGSIFGGGNNTNPVAPATASIFGGNSTNAATPATVNNFGGSNNAATSTSGSVFGGGQNQTPSIFGNSNQTTTPTFGFMGTATTTSVFGTSNTTSNVFGSSNTSTTSGSIFGNKPSLFGGSQNQNQASSSLFGNSSSGTSSIFSGKPINETQPQNASVFGLNTTSGSTFGGSGNTNSSSGGTGLFGSNSAGMQSGSIFGNTGDSSGSTGLFGKQPDSQASSQLNTASQTIGGSSVPGNVKAEWFTPMDQLDPADKGQFEAEVFTSIPLCPPPVELCF
ncbi:nucleoporin NUP42-like [Macrobrachium rosenbergii]|uniref:nucleoporin NUP42-like n=1 Tax=Macrobrachium rosenbergii TaxID=79674 RepID=UPI0034D780EF